MRRKVLITLLALGAVLGFAGGLARLAFHARHGHFDRKAAFERRVASLCAEAALEARGVGPKSSNDSR